MINRNIQLAFIGIVVLLLFAGLSGCTDTTAIHKEKIVGQWRGTSSVSNQTPIFTFYANGSILVTFDTVSTWGVYTLSDERIRLQIARQQPILFDYTFSNNYNTLTCIQTSGEGIFVFTRQ